MSKMAAFQKIVRDLAGVGAVPVPARMFTWEVVTSFEAEPTLHDLQKKFAEEFPDVQCNPVFWKMVSFNSGAGRGHRYLVAVLEADAECVADRRLLPAQVGLFEVCDRLMRKQECGGNLRYSAVVQGVLYVLVFMEGRLCHWSEEQGYGEKQDCLERLARFDEFLKRDSLFSKVENFADVFDENANFDGFKTACRDPFWRKLDLNASTRKRPFYGPWRLLLPLICCVCLAFLFMNFEIGEADGTDIVLLSAPELDAPEQDFSLLDTLGMVIRKRAQNIHGGGEDAPSKDACDIAEIRLQGIVEGKIARVVLADHRKSWLRPGDTLSSFRVESIGRDRVNLLCGTEIRVVFMEGYSDQTATR